MREGIIDRSLAHKFTNDDFAAIKHSLIGLDGLSNRAAWNKIFAAIPQEYLHQSLSANEPNRSNDALGDLGSDKTVSKATTGLRYQRDPQVRQAVEARAKGRCEYCNEVGFARPDGSVYVETHHIIALADDGADRVSNVIALCAGHHREAHFGANRSWLEQDFIAAVKRKVS